MSKVLRVLACVACVASSQGLSAQVKCSTEVFGDVTQNPINIDGEFDLPPSCTLDFGAREVNLGGALRGVDLTIVAGRLNVGASGAIQGGSGTTTIILQPGPRSDGSAEILGALESSGDHAGDILIEGHGPISVGSSGKLACSAAADAGRGGLISIETAGDITLEAGSSLISTGGAAAEFGGEVFLHSSGASIVVAAVTLVTGGTLVRGSVTAVAAGDLVLAGSVTARGRCAAGACSRGGQVQLTAGGSLNVGGGVLDVGGSDGGVYSQDGAGGEVTLDSEGKMVVDGGLDLTGGEISAGGTFHARTSADYAEFGAAVHAQGRTDGSSGGRILIEAGGSVRLDGAHDVSGGASADAGAIQVVAEGDIAVSGNQLAKGNYPTDGIELLSNHGSLSVNAQLVAGGIGPFGTGGVIGLYAAEGIVLNGAILDAPGNGADGLGGTVRLSSFQEIHASGGSLLASGDALGPDAPLGEGGLIDIHACRVAFDPSAFIQATGAVGGNVSVTASDGIRLASASVGAQEGGLITLKYPPGALPDLAGSNFAPDPLLLQSAAVEPCPLPLPPAGTPFVRGNCNGREGTDISDPIQLLNFLFQGTVPSLPCEKGCDANDDGRLDLSDAVFTLAFLFLGGPPPHEPLASCGLDPTDDGLTCGEFSACAAQ